MLFLLLSPRMNQPLLKKIPGRNSASKAVILLWLAFCPLLAGAQFILSGDFDGRLNYLNLRRTISDSLNSKTLNFFGSGELDLKYLHKKWNVYGSVFVTYTVGTNVFSTQAQGGFGYGFYEAWARYYFSRYFSLQAGRIEIDYDDQRFFEVRDWNGLVTSHNAIIAHYLKPDTTAMVDLCFAANKFDPGTGVFSTNRSVNNYRYMSYLYANKRVFDKQLSLTFMNIFSLDDNGVDKTVLYGRNTIGMTGWLSLDDWDFDLCGYYQFGHVNDGRSLSAWYAAAYISYNPVEWLVLMPAFEHLSGDNFADSAEWKKEVHGFSLLYGNMTRSFGTSGLLDETYRANLHPGLNNLYFTANFGIARNFSIEASYHWFSLAQPYIRQFNPDSGKFIFVKVPRSFLHQVEVLFTYTPTHSLELSLDYQLLFPGTAMMHYKGWNFNPGSPVSTAYIEVDWYPDLYPRKKKNKTLQPYTPRS